VILALDAAASAADALDQAAPLAESLGAELRGLFVADERVLAFADAYGLAGVDGLGQPRRYDRDQARRALDAAAALQRELVERMARRRHLLWSFTVSRGSLATQIRAAEPEAELLIVAATRRRRRHRHATLVVVLDQLNPRVVDLAARLANRGPVLAIIPVAAPHLREALEQGVGGAVSFHEVAEVGPREVAAELEGLEGSLVVASAEGPWLDPESLEAIRMRAPLLLVR
jgi:hypothetical protein